VTKGLRIVGGMLRGRPIKAPGRVGEVGEALHPTADRVRESLFNVLLHGVPGFDIAGVTVIDAFAGTGALGLEALSRGAGHAVFVDKAPAAISQIRENAGRLGLARQATILKLDLSRLPPPPLAAKAPAALVFLDAPYEQGLTAPALAALAAKGWLKPGAVAIAEVATKEPLDPPKGFQVFDERTYGRARLIFLRFA
jgi:16S rRNA (guanine966-N2)-methyltransferase